MRLKFKFHGIPWSDDAVEYASHRFEKLKKFEWKSFSVQVTFSEEDPYCRAEVCVVGRELSVKATAEGESHAEAIDLVVDKLFRQLERKKARVKGHRVYENTREGKLNRALRSPKAS